MRHIELTWFEAYCVTWYDTCEIDWYEAYHAQQIIIHKLNSCNVKTTTNGTRTSTTLLSYSSHT